MDELIRELEQKGIHGERQKPFLDMYAKLKARAEPSTPLIANETEQHKGMTALHPSCPIRW